jgi:nucleoside diphosphate kinase
VVKYLTGGYHSFPWVYAFVYYGEDACAKIRQIVGRTIPRDRSGTKDCHPETEIGRNVIVLDDFGNERFDEDGHVLVRFENVLHASFSDMSEYEVKLWFQPEEILSHARLYPVVEDGEGGLMWLHRQRMFCASGFAVTDDRGNSSSDSRSAAGESADCCRSETQASGSSRSIEFTMAYECAGEGGIRTSGMVSRACGVAIRREDASSFWSGAVWRWTT